MTDKEDGTRRVLEHLRSLGHESIAYYGPDLALKAFCTGLAECGLSHDASRVFLFENAPYHDLSLTAYRSAAALLRRRKEFTAVYCSNDFVAMGLISRMEDDGLRPGAGLSVAGFDDIEGTIAPTRGGQGLTTVHKPRDEMGRCAAKMLLDRMEGRRVRRREVKLPCRLVARTSTARAR
jgi:DNA-binding LacI/PurR family transcriptional regulator